MKVMVLGGGAQGSAAAFDLVGRDAVDEVVIADVNVDAVPAFLEPHVGGKLRLERVDATDEDAVRAAMVGMDAVVCALPYYFNLSMTRLAIEAGAHYCDLGGNTEIVEQQKQLDAQARERGVSVIPDCGLAPGMVNILAQAGIDAMDRTESVKIWVGGLPQHPKPPLNYQIVYSMHGVLDYYTTRALILENGEPREVEALDGMESVEFPEPVGELEAFYTAGGISSMPYRYRGKIPTMWYKTLRYPGHAHIMRAIRELGLIDQDPIEVGGCEVSPREFFIETVSPRLRNPDGDDLVALRVEVKGTRPGGPHTVRYDLVDFYDAEHGITAMMRTTGYSLAITGVMQVDGRVAGPGVHTPDEAVPAGPYLEELARHGIDVKRSEG
ncbi:MAG: saccharopine dehydrogenase [Gemmatimonadetes bacterium]|nr:MAG: saccharopine dehydrogenase [Gemmatimonadota bacterium]